MYSAWYAATDMLIFSTQKSEYLAKKLATALKASLALIERQTFNDGEHYMRITKPLPADIIGQPVVIVASITNDAELLEIQRLGVTLAHMNAGKIIFAIPFLAYSTMEVAKLPGEIVMAKTNAHLLSHFPKPHNNTFVFLDLHEASLTSYFEGDTTAQQISAIDILAKALKKKRISKPIIGSADLGMPLQVQHLAKLMKADVALVSKSRTFSHTAVLAAVGNVKNRNVIIYDDMVRSGESLTNAAEAYKKAGAKKVYAAISHLAITNKQALQALVKSPIELIVTTNSHPASQEYMHKKVQVEPVIGEYARFIKRLV